MFNIKFDKPKAIITMKAMVLLFENILEGWEPHFLWLRESQWYLFLYFQRRGNARSVQARQDKDGVGSPTPTPTKRTATEELSR